MIRSYPARWRALKELIARSFNISRARTGLTPLLKAITVSCAAVTYPHPASVTPVRFETLSELDTIDLYLVSMGRGQSDENRIKEVEHEKEKEKEKEKKKEKEEEATLRGA
jgi:hypothetical protein